MNKDEENDMPPKKEGFLSVVSTTLWIGNIPRQLTDQDLLERCKEYGEVVKMESSVNKAGEIAGGYAFVTFKRRSEATKALSELRKWILYFNNSIRIRDVPRLIKEKDIEKDLKTIFKEMSIDQNTIRFERVTTNDKKDRFESTKCAVVDVDKSVAIDIVEDWNGTYRNGWKGGKLNLEFIGIDVPASKQLVVSWVQGMGLKEGKGKKKKSKNKRKSKFSQDYWNEEQGVSYIPHEDLKLLTDVKSLEEGGKFDESTIPEWMKNDLGSGLPTTSNPMTEGDKQNVS